MLDHQVNTLGVIWKDPSSRGLLNDGGYSLMKCVLLGDLGSGVDALKAGAELVFHTPTVLYWNKMWRYMCGIFRDGADQVKMAERFEDDNPKYKAFVEKQMHIVNELNDDEKIDYMAQLTRCYLFGCVEENLYLKLAKFLDMCTPGELEFLAGIPYGFSSKNTIMISSLYQYGLFMQSEDDDETRYVLSDYGKALKQNSLNFDEGLQGQKRFSTYGDMAPLNLLEAATWEDMENSIKW